MKTTFKATVSNSEGLLLSSYSIVMPESGEVKTEFPAFSVKARDILFDNTYGKENIEFSRIPYTLAYFLNDEPCSDSGELFSEMRQFNSLWEREHFDANIPTKVVTRLNLEGLEDVSWHNDLMPSFEIREIEGIPTEEVLPIRVWVNYFDRDENDEELNDFKQYQIQWETRRDYGDYEDDLASDNLDEIIARVRELINYQINNRPGSALNEVYELLDKLHGCDFAIDDLLAIFDAEFFETLHLCKRKSQDYNDLRMIIQAHAGEVVKKGSIDWVKVQEIFANKFKA